MPRLGFAPPAFSRVERKAHLIPVLYHFNEAYRWLIDRDEGIWKMDDIAMTFHVVSDLSGQVPIWI
jgi:hypothetical protein